MSDTGRSELHRKIDELTNPEVEVVNRFVGAILTPVDSDLNPHSWLTIRPWADAFLVRLRAHHALNVEPLSTTAFEAAFNSACRAAGWTVRPAESATNRFFDTVVSIPDHGDVRLSLKATGARGMTASRVHISKLTEAAWIQDARTQADRRRKLVELFREYREQTDSIVILRCFRQADSDSLLYELVELPTLVFASVDDLSVSQAQAATIPLPPGVASADADARIRIDRSDAKITITGIRIEVCTIHGKWTIPNLSGIQSASD